MMIAERCGFAPPRLTRAARPGALGIAVPDPHTPSWRYRHDGLAGIAGRPPGVSYTPLVRSLVVLGTRPEAIKLAPVVLKLRSQPRRHQVNVCVTGQHRELLDQALAAFDLTPDDRLHCMRSDQTLADSTSRVLAGVSEVIERRRPDVVVVQGDTTTTLCGALAGFYARVPVAHVEAGLRTGDYGKPFPEEAHRALIARLADLHFPATPAAAANLVVEGVSPRSIVTTGNTAIDAVMEIRDRILHRQAARQDPIRTPPKKRLLLLTAHRRESFGAGFENICAAVRRLAARGDVHIVCPLHPNPNVRRFVEDRLAGLPAVELIEAVDYPTFVHLMMQAHVILTDSGGVQEEAPALGKPVLVLRETTERQEALESGAARLTGLDSDHIVAETKLLLDDPVEYERRAQPRLIFGDGNAAGRISDALRRYRRPVGLAAAG